MRRGFQDRPCRRFDCHCLLHSAADWNFFEPTCYNRRKDNHHERNYQRLHHWRKNLKEANDALASIGAGVKLDPKRNTIKPGEEADFGLSHSFFQGGIYHEWPVTASASVLAGLLSLLISVAGLPELDDGNSLRYLRCCAEGTGREGVPSHPQQCQVQYLILWTRRRPGHQRNQVPLV